MSNIVALSVVFVCSALASAVLIWLLQPLWRRYALAKPNARSSHKVPTPQSGGIVVITVTVAIVALATAFGIPLAANGRVRSPGVVIPGGRLAVSYRAERGLARLLQTREEIET